MIKALIIATLINGAATYASASETVRNVKHEEIQSTIRHEVSAKAAEGCITLISAEERPIAFHIYSIIGQLVKTVSISAGETMIELPKGYYIVKCEKWTKQVIVR